MLHFFNVINVHYDTDISNKLIFCKDRNTGGKMTYSTLLQILVELMVLNIVF